GDDARRARVAARALRRRRGGGRRRRVRGPASTGEREGRRRADDRRRRGDAGPRARARAAADPPRRGRHARRARGVPRRAGGQSRRADAVRVRGVHRDRPAPALLPARRCRRRRHEARRAGVGRRPRRRPGGGGVHMSEPLVLGIETSCDETGIGIVRGRTLLSNTIASSMDEHARYGGVVPEIAARAHLEALQPAIQAALAEAQVSLADLDAVAVTSGPGLAGALMVGVGAAKALAVSLDKPLYAVNHLVGHIAADSLDADAEPLEYPTVALLVSGGHTSLLLVRDLTTDVELLGETM